MSKLLIIVDMIKGFVNEGAMHDKGIANIIPETINYIEKFINEGYKVLFIKDAHDEDAVEFNDFPKHCLKGTCESELVDELLKYENGQNSIEKNSTSAMFAPGFVEYIEKINDLEEIVIGGCCTDICVLNLAIPLKNYLNQVDKKIAVIVPKSIVETYHAEGVHDREEYNEMAYKLMSQSGIKVI